MTATHALLLAAATTVALACDRPAVAPAQAPPASTAPAAAVVTVASLVPAASDLIVGMGAGDRLVAVSNFDPPDDRTRHLPRVGDYQTVDWEKLATLRPGAMVVQFDRDRVPPGLQQRADGLNIRVVNIHNNRLADVFATLDQLGAALAVPQQATGTVQRLREQLDAVARRVAGRPKVRALVLMDDAARYAVGPNTYIDDLLTIAGGQNVLANARKPYLQIDRERLMALDPAVIICLRPGASEQELEEGRRTMASLATLSAVRDGRVRVLTEPWALLPGSHVGDLAAAFADALHPTPSPASRGAGAAQ